MSRGISVGSSLIAYLMGCSIGVHLLNLLAIPTLAFIYYFRKYEFSWAGLGVTAAVAVGILGLIQTVIILKTFDFAWMFEKTLVGTQSASGATTEGMGLPIGTGLLLFLLLLFAGLIGLIYYSQKAQKPLLNTFAVATLAVYIGFSSYAMIPIRSNANTPIDENNPDNALTFLSYMKREQYGDRPLLYGPLYNSRPYKNKKTKDYILEEGKKRYTESGFKYTPVYQDADKVIFPRMYEPGRYNMGPHGYINYVANKGANGSDPYDDQPTKAEDMRFFFRYQLEAYVYALLSMELCRARKRYTRLRLGEWAEFCQDHKRQPEFVRNNRGKNHYYAIPLLLGLLGLYWQARKRGSDALVVGLLFLFTGFAINIYLNPYPMQPRERDYAYAGSYQTFAIWIGLAVIALYDLIRRGRENMDVGGFIAVAVGLLAPLLMVTQNWDDHSRAGRFIAPDSAYNLLNSLAPNAVLFTNGDNDTFPLWYIQEVEDVRPDVRVLCLSYVNTDWYIDQMYQKVNESEPLPLSLKRSEYQGQANQAKYFREKELRMNLPTHINQLIADDVLSKDEATLVGDKMQWTIPTRGGSQRYLELKDVLIINLLQNTASRDGSVDLLCQYRRTQ